MTRTTILLLLAVAQAALAARLAAQPAPDAQGFLYGKVTTRDGMAYQGRLRWGKEEAFWGDLFNSVKRDRPFEKDVPREYRHRRKPIEIFGVDIGISIEADADRLFVARFGDIARIDVERGAAATVTMKSGSRIRVRGGSNDLGNDLEISVWDAGAGQVDLEWKAIRAIEFGPAPPGLSVPEQRLHGTVRSEGGQFSGFVQWDQDECLSDDKLDGENRDGKVALEMGNLRSIEKRSRRSSRVQLADGREMDLSGTNDVDDDNRGVYVEDGRFGRVLVPWGAFERLDFSPAPAPRSTGPGYREYRHGRPLEGRVLARDGKTYAGRLVFDLDESETWEMLNGTSKGVEYSIPFALVAAIAPTGRDASRVRLTSGAELLLDGSTDVDRDNAGVLIYPADGKAQYLPWERVKRIDFGR